MTSFSKKLFLISTLLLLSRSVRGRGEASTHRRVAVSGRETMEPTQSNGNGKGMKSEKSVKSFGKGLKSEKSVKDDKGKGYKDDKKSKKDYKSDKALKTEKYEKGKGAIVFPSTPAPTSADSILSQSSMFAITYSALKENPSPEDFEQLAMVTQTYLEDVMMDFFDKTALTDLDNFLTKMEKNRFASGQPVIAEYRSDGLFNPDSIFIPVARELDNLIKDAISQDGYSDALNDLPRSNPFHRATTIAFTDPSSSTTGGESTSSSSSSGSGNSSMLRAGVGAAAAGVVVLAAGLALLKRRPSTDDENDDVQSFSPEKSISEEETAHIGDSCTVSVEDPTFAHWRTAKSYNDGINAGEFQDEPLDS